MAVVIETTIGDFTVDLFIDSRPQACKNFLKLCKMKYYNFCLFHSVQPNFLAQTGDPTGTGSGGESIYGLLYGENARLFEAETMPKLKHNKPGLLSMVNCGNNMLGSQFFVTLGEELVSLDGQHCVFGEISEGVEIVLKFNDAICDAQHRPYKDIRITHTIILEDPFDDPSGLIVPDMSPEPTQDRLANGRIGADEEVDETQGLTAEEVEEMRQEREAKARATILEIVGDLPDADMAPPENVLFVCKLNPVTTDDDLEIIFSRFGKVKSCEVIRDKNTGDSLQYAFVEFEEQKACEDAYFKMDNVLIDDRRIHVDFSQSVAKMRWKGKGRGVEYFDNKEQVKDFRNSGNKDREGSRSKGERSSRREREREYEERDRRKDRGRDRDDDRGRDRERERGRDSDDRHRRRDDRDRSRSDWRKRDKRDHREDDKRYDKRREGESSRKREDDSKRVSSSSSSRKGDDKKLDVKRSEEKRIDVKESRSLNGKSASRQREFIKSESLEKSTIKIEKKEPVDKEIGRGSKYSSPLHSLSKDETLSDSFNDSQEVPTPGGESEKSLSLPVNKDVSEVENKIISVSRRSSKDDKKVSESIKLEDYENDQISEGRSSQISDNKAVEGKGSQEKEKKKAMKRKRKESESRKKKKRRHSSSSESSSESSDSSDSSSSSDSSDYKHSKKKKLIVAKKYYRGGKLVKEVKKKKRTKDTSDSESGSEESSDSDSKRKSKSRKHKKVVNSYKHGKKRSVQSSEDSQSESSSSEESDERSRKKKKKASEKKKKSKHSSSKKKKRRKNHSSSSSDSEDSVQSKSTGKKQKKIKNSKHSANLVTTTSE